MVLEEGEDEGEGGGAKQDLDEQVVELLQHQLPQRRALLLLEFVGAVLGPELLDLRRAQALGECDVVRREHSVRVLRPAWHLSLRRLCLRKMTKMRGGECFSTEVTWRARRNPKAPVSKNHETRDHVSMLGRCHVSTGPSQVFPVHTWTISWPSPPSRAVTFLAPS